MKQFNLAKQYVTSKILILKIIILEYNFLIFSTLWDHQLY